MFKFFGDGRLVADPELQEIKSEDGKNACVARFTLATNEYRKVNGEKITYTSFMDCEAWDSGARSIADFIKKGDMLVVTGKVRQNKWETADGHKRSRIIFRIEEFTVGKKAAKNESVYDDLNEKQPE